MQGTFVIQRHQTGQTSHYDLMLEAPDALPTFQLARLPGDLQAGEAISVVRLADHRLLYLTYEGPISGGRGEVRIVQRGRYQAQIQPNGAWHIQLKSPAFTGLLRLEPTGGGRFSLRRQ